MKIANGRDAADHTPRGCAAAYHAIVSPRIENVDKLKKSVVF